MTPMKKAPQRKLIPNRGATVLDGGNVTGSGTFGNNNSSSEAGPTRQALKREGRMVLYRLLNANANSRVRNLGYELTITATESGKIERSWFYETSELRWSEEGWKTLTDAQTRNVLGSRSAWKPYNARSRSTSGPAIVRKASADGWDGIDPDSLESANSGETGVAD